MNDIDAGRIKTGVDHLDLLLKGGLPRQSVTVFGGTPGTGKTILSQQICFNNATPQKPAVIFNTLSEPTAKTLRYLRPFAFFDEKKVGRSVHFVDLGGIMRTKGLNQATELFMEQLRRIKPAFVVIDSFKVFDDLASSREELRKFTYEIAVNLMAWECTAFLLGEFEPAELGRTPLSSIVDGIMILAAREEGGEQQRFLQVLKMRGTDHDRNIHPLQISPKGIEIFVPRAALRRPETTTASLKRGKLGVASFDSLAPDGVPYGSSLIVAGNTGTGKSTFALEALYRGARDRGEKGIYFTFEETPDRLLASARTMGWDVEREIKRGMLKIVYVPQPDILVQQHLLMIQREVETFKAKRVIVDSVSVFLQKLERPAAAREKIYQLATIVQRAGAVGLFVTEVPYGVQRISRFGVEDTVVDGIVLLTTTEEGRERRRWFEIYKLRNSRFIPGRQPMTIGPKGIEIEKGG